MADYDKEDGVWRTVGGRRIFIRNGQSLSDAMKESGKFKKKDEAENKPKTNRIPRDYDKITYTQKIESSAGKVGDKFELSKDEYGQTITKNLRTGETYQANMSMLRSSEAVEINDIIKNNKEDKFYTRKDGTKELLSEENYANDLHNGKTNATYSEWKKEKQGIKPQTQAEKNRAFSIYGKEDSTKDYKNKIFDVAKNSKEDNVTLDVETGKAVSFEKGYSVSFQQSTDNYTDAEFYSKVEECKAKCDGKLYAGKYGGDPEPSFHTDNLDDAKEIMYKYNQESIYDWEHDTLIMNDKYDASKNKTNYKEEQTTNDIMNKAIKDKVESKRNKNTDDLPKKTEIKEQGTSNRKEVSENIQAHILEYYDSPDDFVRQMDAMDYLPTRWKAGEELAKGGNYLIYNGDMSDFLDSLKINPKGKKFSEDKAFDMYTSLVGRESAKLYDRLEKNAYKKYMREHPLSKISFSDFKDMKKGGK